MARMSWDSYFIQLAKLASERATCDRLHVGCILVKDKRVIATAYNGSVSGMPHCNDVGCKVVDNHCIRTIHAEQNAIFQCAKFGVSTEGSTLYITHFPCLNCTKAIIQSGISKIVYLHDYHNNEYATELLENSGIEVVKFKKQEIINEEKTFGSNIEFGY